MLGGDELVAGDDGSARLADAVVLDGVEVAMCSP